jgi:hypothetical protein
MAEQYYGFNLVSMLTFWAKFDTINLMETLLYRPIVETPGSLDMSGFEAAFEAPDAIPAMHEEVSAAAELTAPAFNPELVAMFMRAHGNEQLTNLLAGIVAADMLTKNMLYQQEQAQRDAAQRRGDDYRAFDLIVENSNLKDEDEKVAA